MTRMRCRAWRYGLVRRRRRSRGLPSGWWPGFVYPGWEGVALFCDRELDVLVAAALGVEGESVGDFVVDLEAVAVGVGEVDRALADVVHAVRDRHFVVDQRAVGVLERGVAGDLEGDVE